MSNELNLLRARMRHLGLSDTDSEVAHKSLWEIIFGGGGDDDGDDCAQSCSPGCSPGCITCDSGCSSGGSNG